jgi:hypothetical protein
MKDRDRFMLATGPILGYIAGSVRRAAEKALHASGSDYLDVVQVLESDAIKAHVRVSSAMSDETRTRLGGREIREKHHEYQEPAGRSCCQ